MSEGCPEYVEPDGWCRAQGEHACQYGVHHFRMRHLCVTYWERRAERAEAEVARFLRPTSCYCTQCERLARELEALRERVARAVSVLQTAAAKRNYSAVRNCADTALVLLNSEEA